MTEEKNPLISKLSVLKKKIDELETAKSELSKEFEELKRELLLEMQEKELEQVKGEGISCLRQTKMNASITDVIEYIATLKDYPELLRKQVNTQPLKQLYENGIIPKGISISEYEYLMIRKTN